MRCANWGLTCAMVGAVAIVAVVMSGQASARDKEIHANDCYELDYLTEPGSPVTCPGDSNVWLRAYNRCPYGEILVDVWDTLNGRTRIGSFRVGPKQEKESRSKAYCVPRINVDIGIYHSIDTCGEWGALRKSFIRQREEDRGVNYIFVSNCHN